MATRNRRTSFASLISAPLDPWFPARVTAVITPLTSPPQAADYRYTFVEVWRVPDEGWQVKTAGRYGSTLNPGAAIGDTILSVGQHVLCRSSDGEAGLDWLLFGAPGISGDEDAVPDETEDGAIPGLTPNGDLRPQNNFTITNFTYASDDPDAAALPWTQVTLQPPGDDRQVSTQKPLIQFAAGTNSDGNFEIRQSVWNNANEKEGVTNTTVYDPGGRMVATTQKFTLPNPDDPDGDPIIAIKQWTVDPATGTVIENNTNISIELDGEEVTAGGGSSGTAAVALVADSGAFSAQTSVALTNITGYKFYRIVGYDLVSSVAMGSQLGMQTSANNGSSYDSLATDYTTLGANGSSISIGTLPNTNSACFELIGYNLGGTSVNKIFRGNFDIISGVSSAGILASRNATALVNAFKFAPASGTFSGRIVVFGYN